MNRSEYALKRMTFFAHPLRQGWLFGLVLLALVGAVHMGGNAHLPVVGADVWQAQAEVITETVSFVVEYPLPAHVPDAQPHQIIASAPGHLWFTLPGANALGSLVVTTTVDFAFAIFDLPTTDSEPHDLVLDENAGVIWFTQRAADQIGRLEIGTGQIDEFPMPTGSLPTGITLASNGFIWVSLPGTNQIARFDPSNETASFFNPPRANAGFTDIEEASNGLIWVVASADNRLVSYNPSNGVFVNVVVGDFGSPPVAPYALVLQGNTPWITVPSKGWLGRYSPGTLNLWFWYTTASSEGGATALAYRIVGDSQEFWYIQPSSNRAGRMLINSQGRVQQHYLAGLPTSNSDPRGIAVDANGHAWVTATQANAIVEWRPTYVFQTHLPVVMR